MGEILRIESTPALAELLSGIGSGPIAVDTEADSFHHYRDRVCLIQLSCHGRDALVDPLADVDVRRLAPVLADRSVLKILHGADYDIRILRRDYQLSVGRLFDTMIAARLAGETAVGLAALLERFLAIGHDKSHQRADWSRRPLTPEMVAYAALDTRHLAELASLLTERLDALGRRAWAEEEFSRLEALAWRDPREDDPEPFRRVKGAARLDRAGLAVLREIWTWRDGMARRRDLPAFRVMRDETLQALASTPPESVSDLAKVAGFPQPLLRSPSAHDLVEAARRGAACDPDRHPEVRTVARPRPDPVLEAETLRLKEVRDRVATELALEPSLVASRATLEDVARRRIAGADPWEGADLRAWQRDLLAPRL
jgi:ribonuclease D